MTTGLFHLRALQAGLSISDLEKMSVGMVFDIFTESGNDIDGDYAQLATQEDIDRL